MSRILAIPWNFPPAQMEDHRLVSIIDLEKGTTWASVSKYFKNYKIERTFFFGTQGLIQFDTAEEAQRFVKDKKYYIPELRATVTISSIASILALSPTQKKMKRSPVICLQITRLRCYLGIHDIYDECSNFGIVQKIICFKNKEKFALVQMETIDQASLALANLSKLDRYSPSFEIHAEFSKCQSITVQYNNSKSFDFTVPGAMQQFELLKEGLTNELPFFEPEESNVIPKAFNFVRPVQFDPAYGNSLTVNGLIAPSADFVRNIFKQYGAVLKVKLIQKQGQYFSFIQMRNAFYARLAMTNIDKLFYKKQKIKVELSSKRDVHPETNKLNGQIDFQDYSQNQEDPDLITFVNMWIPSEYVSVRPNTFDLKSYALEYSAKYIEDKNILQFRSIDEATTFIGNFIPNNSGKIVLHYCKPPELSISYPQSLVN